MTNLLLVFILIFSSGYSLTRKEKIAQSFIVPVCPCREEKHFSDVQKLTSEYAIGGFILKHGTPLLQIQIINELQSKADIPYLCTLDGEWGLAMNMKDVPAMPMHMTLGAIEDLALIEEAGELIGKQCKQVGIHINFAPVVDVNSNPLNPIIHMRSFGSSPTRVAEHAKAYARGLKKTEIVPVIKHFPGHGDVSVDSHFDLPSIKHAKEHLLNCELIPFKELFREQIDAVMLAHLNIPAFDEMRPSSLSKSIIQDLLQTQMHFNGYIFSDALNMKALTNQYTIEEIAVEAYKAGIDFLLYGDHIHDHVDQIINEMIPKAIDAIDQSAITDEEIDQKFQRVCQLKRRCIKDNGSPKKLEDLFAEVTTLNQKIYENALTLVKDPLTLMDSITDFQLSTRDNFDINKEKECLVITGMNKYVKEHYGVSEDILAYITNRLDHGKDTIVILLGTPYAAKLIDQRATVIVGYEENQWTLNLVKKLIQEGLELKGYLPVQL